MFALIFHVSLFHEIVKLLSTNLWIPVSASYKDPSDERVVFFFKFHKATNLKNPISASYEDAFQFKRLCVKIKVKCCPSKSLILMFKLCLQEIHTQISNQIFVNIKTISTLPRNIVQGNKIFFSPQSHQHNTLQITLRVI